MVWPSWHLLGELSCHLPPKKGSGRASPFFWKWPLFRWGIFTFHSHPQTDGKCPVPDSDMLSSPAPSKGYHPAPKNNKLFLGHICMSSCSPSVLRGHCDTWICRAHASWGKAAGPVLRIHLPACASPTLEVGLILGARKTQSEWGQNLAAVEAVF